MCIECEREENLMCAVNQRIQRTCKVVILLLFLKLISVNVVRCYECNSYNDLRCAEKEPPKELEKDCEEISAGNKYTFCRKITQVIEFSVNSRKYKIHIN